MRVPDIPKLERCLEARSWRQLLALMNCHGLACSTRWTKAQLIASLSLHLREQSFLEVSIANLEPSAYDALRALVDAGGQLPAERFGGLYGGGMPVAPLGSDDMTQAVTPAQQLWVQGLIFLWPRRITPGTVQRVVIASDLLAAMAEVTEQVRPGMRQVSHWRCKCGRVVRLIWIGQ